MTATATKPINLPATIRPEDVTVVIDAREQLPWNLAPLRSVPGTLATGDYSIKGLESVIALERKSLTDFVSCYGNERARFKKEIHRLLSYPARAIVIESTWPALAGGEWRSKVTPQSVVASATGWIAQGVPIVLEGDRM